MFSFIIDTIKIHRYERNEANTIGRPFELRIFQKIIFNTHSKMRISCVLIRKPAPASRPAHPGRPQPRQPPTDPQAAPPSPPDLSQDAPEPEKVPPKWPQNSLQDTPKQALQRPLNRPNSARICQISGPAPQDRKWPPRTENGPPSPTPPKSGLGGLGGPVRPL